MRSTQPVISDPSDGCETAAMARDPEKCPYVFNEQTNFVPKRTIVTIFLACASVDLLALMDQTTLAASLSIISDELAAGDLTSWVAAGYFVTSTSFQLLYGRFSDIWSRKVILYVGLAIVFIGSLAASLAQTAVQLIIFRAFTGIGGGGLMTVAQMIVSDTVPLRERGKYQGILGAVVALANGIGPVIGGSLASISPGSWRWIFRLNLPITVLTTACVMFFMPLKKVEGDWKLKLRAIDFTGVLLALGGTVVLMLGLIWSGGGYAWNSTHVIATLVVGLFFSAVFVVWQWKGTSTPLIPMHIFKSRIVNGASLTMFINGWNFLVQFYYIPLFYQMAYGYSATKAASLLLPITLTQSTFDALFIRGQALSPSLAHISQVLLSFFLLLTYSTLAASSTLSGFVVHWVGRYRESILLGWIMWAVGLGLFSTLDQSSGVGKQIGYGILTGFGLGNTLQPALIAIQAGVARRDMAVVSSFRNFIRNLGGTLGLAAAGTIIHNILLSSVSHLNLSRSQTSELLKSPSTFLSTLPETEAVRVRSVLVPAYQKAFRIIFLIGAGLAALAFFLALFLMPQVTLERPDDDALKEEGKRSTKARRRLSGGNGF